jgi:hypothetical protein
LYHTSVRPPIPFWIWVSRQCINGGAPLAFAPQATRLFVLAPPNRISGASTCPPATPVPLAFPVWVILFSHNAGVVSSPAGATWSPLDG